MFTRDDPNDHSWTPWRGPCPACGAALRITPGEMGDECPACGSALAVVGADTVESPSAPPGTVGVRLRVDVQ